MEEYFITLFDFQTTTGWELVDGKYVNTSADVIKAAEAFTAPGWLPGNNYITYTQVVVYELDGALFIELWANAEFDSAKLVSGATVSGTNVLFSYAKITK